MLRRKLQCLLVGAHRLVETTLRNPDIRQGDGATDCVRDVPGLLQLRHALGIRPVRCLEIPARPGGESQERRCRSALEMVVLRDEVERPPGVFHGAGHIAQSQGLSGTVHGDRTRETAKFLFVHDDHRRRRGVRSRAHVCRRVQPPFGVPQAGLNALELAARQ